MASEDTRFPELYTGSGEFSLPHRVIFPILVLGSDARHSAVGTGFFVATHGLFLTAMHVLDNLPEDFEDVLIPHFEHQGPLSSVLRSAVLCAGPKKTDVAFGVLSPVIDPATGYTIPSPRLAVSSALPEVGERVCSFSFPQTVVCRQGETDAVVLLGRWSTGLVTAVYPEGRDSVLQPGAVVETDMHIPNGGSGGPVFNPRGQVFGVVSTGIDGISTNVAPLAELLDTHVLDERTEGEAEIKHLRLRDVCEVDVQPRNK